MNVCREQKREARRVRREDAFSIIALDTTCICGERTLSRGRMQT